VGKHTTFRALLEVEMWEKSTALWRETHLELKSVSEHFWTFRRCFVWQAQGILHNVKNELNV
jgi:hypothetical protein